MLSVCHLNRKKQMATKNPRVVGYVSPANHAKLREFMEQEELSESKALDVILSAYFGTPSTLKSVTLGIPSDIPDRVATLEQQIAELRVELGEFAA
jgi:ABC-type molybdenum transport system ATPase subunit/photorepair protein PhrA